MKKISLMRTMILAWGLILLTAAPAAAHFGMIIPSTDVVEKNQTIDLDLRFAHPFDGPVMNLTRPREFGVAVRGRRTDLLNSLKPVKIDGHQAFTAQVEIKRPGDHVFYMVPQPYWEPAEDVFIVHQTKVVVNSKGLEVGWDQPLGLQAEIVPLTRPYGLWASNLFTGQVLLDGKPVPGAEVEVEPYVSGKVKAPAGVFVTQVVKADANGVFSYALPAPGWWGFAALMEGPDKMKGPDGKQKGIELGAVMWIKAYPWPGVK